MTLRIHPIVLASVLTFGLVGQAFAHAHLKAATPAMDATVTTAPTHLDLVFSEGVNPKFTGVTVTGPGGGAISTGEAKLGPAGDKALVVPVSGTLAPGLYKVEWHALATDGHKTEGSYTFTVKP
jgi:hypothetical protein